METELVTLNYILNRLDFSWSSNKSTKKWLNMYRCLRVVFCCCYKLTSFPFLPPVSLNPIPPVFLPCRSLTLRSSTICWKQQRAMPRRARASSPTSPDTSSASWASPGTPWRVFYFILSDVVLVLFCASEKFLSFLLLVLLSSVTDNSL